MMATVISGIGWVTATGHGWGKGGQEFTMGAGPLTPLPRKEVFSEPNQRYGRQSDYSKLGLAAIAFALRDAGLENWGEKRPVGIVAASMLGSLATDLDYFHSVLPEGGGLPSPNLFAYTLANCFMGEAAIQFGLTGSTMVINDTGSNGLAPLRLALESIAWGEHDTMVAGICDLPTPEPLEGLFTPATGALFLVLSRNSAAPGSAYGTLALNADDAILHNDIETSSIAELVSTCLAGRG
jgi:3-oxoacyl-[acyl-carrier-protein] synthase II